MKLLITGISGLSGKYILNHPARPRGAEIVGTSRRFHAHPDFEKLSAYHAVDFSQQAEYGKIIDLFRPDVIVHLGGDGNVDSVEKNQEASRISNLEFPLFLIRKAEGIGAKLVQFSSNAVYDGKRAPYSEKSPANPLNSYGGYKAQVDEATRNYRGDWLILRPIVMYGWNYSFGRNNPVSQFVPMLQAGKSIRMVTDQFENPVYAGDIAEVFWKCIREKITGEYNLGGSDRILSRYDWLRAVAAELGVDPDLVQPASINDFVLPAQRPRDTRLDISRMQSELKVQPVNVREGLRLMLEEADQVAAAA